MRTNEFPSRVPIEKCPNCGCKRLFLRRDPFDIEAASSMVKIGCSACNYLGSYDLISKKLFTYEAGDNVQLVSKDILKDLPEIEALRFIFDKCDVMLLQVGKCYVLSFGWGKFVPLTDAEHERVKPLFEKKDG